MIRVCPQNRILLQCNPCLSKISVFIMAYCLILFLNSGVAVEIPFAPGSVISSSADGVWCVFAADVNRDGLTDVISASANDNRILWFENLGTSPVSFTTHTVTTSVQSPRGVFAGDIDRDGDLDIVSVSSGDDSVVWYENDGEATPSFTPHTISSSAGGAWAVFVADVNRDGDLDVLAALADDNKIVLYENSQGDGSTWTPTDISTTVLTPRSVVAGDIDNDGDIDVLSASEADDTVAWYENLNGDASTWSPHIISTTVDEAQSVSVGDLNDDGHLDVITASPSTSTLIWYENDGTTSPSFTTQFISLSNGATWVFPTDLDCDGDIDVLSASYNDHTIAWFENNGGATPTFTYRAISTTAENATAAVSADLDHDGDLEVISASSGNDTIAWFKNKTIHRNAVFPAQDVISTATLDAKAAIAADLNNDGKMDIITASSGTDKIIWFENTGTTPPVFIPHTVTTQADWPFAVFAVDLDRDGDMDVLSASVFDDKVSWSENNGGSPPTFTHHTIASDADGARSVYAADLDGDGDIDVLSASRDDDKIAWYENDGNSPPGFTTHIITKGADGARQVCAADINGDGKLDVVACSYNDDEVTWFRNDGNSPPSFTTCTISTTADGAFSIFTTDLDRDGDVDILCASALNDRITWFENDGATTPTFTARTITTTADGPWSVFAADLDNDGDIDVLSASYNDDKIAWYENDGGSPPGFIPHTITTLTDRPRTVYAADLDDDGDHRCHLCLRV